MRSWGPPAYAATAAIAATLVAFLSVAPMLILLGDPHPMQAELWGTGYARSCSAGQECVRVVPVSMTVANLMVVTSSLLAITCIWTQRARFLTAAAVTLILSSIPMGLASLVPRFIVPTGRTSLGWEVDLFQAGVMFAATASIMLLAANSMCARRATAA